MRLSWKDGVATAAVALVVTVYLLFAAGADVVLISSAQGAGTAMLLFGIVGCAYGAADELFEAKGSTARKTYIVITSALGVTAAAAGLLAVIFGYEIALTVLLAATVTMWLLATARHAANTWRVPRMTGGVPQHRREGAPL